MHTRYTHEPALQDSPISELSMKHPPMSPLAQNTSNLLGQSIDGEKDPQSRYSDGA